MTTETLKILTADKGKTFKRIYDGEILGNKISFDTRYESEFNFIEIDEPLPIENQEGNK